MASFKFDRHALEARIESLLKNRCCPPCSSVSFSEWKFSGDEKYDHNYCSTVSVVRGRRGGTIDFSVDMSENGNNRLLINDRVYETNFSYNSDLPDKWFGLKIPDPTVEVFLLESD